MKIMEQCLEIIGLAKNAVPNGNRNAVSDGAAEFAVRRWRSRLTCGSTSSIEDERYWDIARRLDEILYMGTTTAADRQGQNMWKPKQTTPPFGGLGLRKRVVEAGGGPPEEGAEAPPAGQARHLASRFRARRQALGASSARTSCEARAALSRP
jgi:hypothetical protein